MNVGGIHTAQKLLWGEVICFAKQIITPFSLKVNRKAMKKIKNNKEIEPSALEKKSMIILF